MNDFYTVFGLVCLYVGAGGTAYLAGRIFRGTTRELEVRARVARLAAADGGTFTVPDSVRHPDGNGTGACTDSDCDLNGGAYYLGNYRDARRRTVLRDNSRPGGGRHSLGGDSRGTDEEAVA